MSDTTATVLIKTFYATSNPKNWFPLELILDVSTKDRAKVLLLQVISSGDSSFTPFFL
jgi:hypothetical protein